MKAKRRLLILAAAVALVLVGLVVLIPRRHEQLYKVTILPTLGGWQPSPRAINDQGQIVGFAYDASAKDHLLLWDREKGMQDLGPVLRWEADINNAGQIAATVTDSNGNRQAFLWDPTNGRQMLGTLGGAESVAQALNNNGQVVGVSDSSDGQPQPFIWDRTHGVRMLPKGRQQAGRATGINDAGQFMGFVGSLTAPNIPCFWDSTDPDDEAAPMMLGALYPATVYPGGSDLNNDGYVLGRTYHRERGGMWASLWKEESGFKYLFPLVNSVHPPKFNDANQVLYGEKHISSLGRFFKKYFQPYTQCCVWDPKRGKIVLDKQIPREMGKLEHLQDINNQGCIIGTIRVGNLGKTTAVLLEPIPERWGK